MPTYEGVINISYELEAKDEDEAYEIMYETFNLYDTQVVPTIHEIPAHRGKKIIGYECTACDRSIVPMYDAGKMMCPWCRGKEYVITVYKED